MEGVAEKSLLHYGPQLCHKESKRISKLHAYLHILGRKSTKHKINQMKDTGVVETGFRTNGQKDGMNYQLRQTTPFSVLLLQSRLSHAGLVVDLLWVDSSPESHRHHNPYGCIGLINILSICLTSFVLL